jgi:F1F0 ATPase subunit 2
MDDERMNFSSFAGLSSGGEVLGLAGTFIAGAVAGSVYFRALWWSTKRFVDGGRASATIAVALGRFILLALLLVLAGRQGAASLLAMALGVLLARYAVVRRVREAAS